MTLGQLHRFLVEHRLAMQVDVFDRGRFRVELCNRRQDFAGSGETLEAAALAAMARVPARVFA